MHGLLSEEMRPNKIRHSIIRPDMRFYTKPFFFFCCLMHRYNIQWRNWEFFMEE